MNQPPARDGLEKRSLTLAGHRTSVALEREFWEALEAISAERHETVLKLVLDIDAKRTQGQRLASALRVFTLRYRPD